MFVPSSRCVGRVHAWGESMRGASLSGGQRAGKRSDRIVHNLMLIVDNHFVARGAEGNRRGSSQERAGKNASVRGE